MPNPTDISVASFKQTRHHPLLHTPLEPMTRSPEDIRDEWMTQWREAAREDDGAWLRQELRQPDAETADLVEGMMTMFEHFPVERPEDEVVLPNYLLRWQRYGMDPAEEYLVTVRLHGDQHAVLFSEPDSLPNIPFDTLLEELGTERIVVENYEPDFEENRRAVAFVEEALSLTPLLSNLETVLPWNGDETYCEVELSNRVGDTIVAAYRHLETPVETSFIETIHEAWDQMRQHRQAGEPLSETTSTLGLRTDLSATVEDASHIAFELALEHPDVRDQSLSLFRDFAEVLSNAPDVSEELHNEIRLHEACLLVADREESSAWQIISEVFDRPLADDPEIETFLESIENKRASDYRALVSSLETVSVLTDTIDFDKDEFYVY